MRWLIAFGCAFAATVACAHDNEAGRQCLRVVRPAVIFYEHGYGITDAEKAAISDCIRRNALWPYDKAELKRVGLYDQLASLH